MQYETYVGRNSTTWFFKEYLIFCFSLPKLISSMQFCLKMSWIYNGMCRYFKEMFFNKLSRRLVNELLALLVNTKVVSIDI